MQISKTKKIFAGIIIIIILGVSLLFAQDTTAVKTDTAKTNKTGTDIEIGEIELMEITIEAVIEKPRVNIMPRRVEPELGEMEFIDRSFENELKKGPDKPFLIEERLKTPEKVKLPTKKSKK